MRRCLRVISERNAKVALCSCVSCRCARSAILRPLLSIHAGTITITRVIVNSLVDDAHVWSHERISNTFHETTHVDPTPYLTKHNKTWDELIADIKAAPSVLPTVVPADPSVGTGTVSDGATGPQVVAIQNLLKAKGLDVGAVDGVFGPATKAVVMAFQRSCNLTADGIVGPQTLSKLRS